jgi:hypothetical protein
MRLSSLSIAAVLLFSSTVFAQHSSSSSVPSTPPPPPPAPAAAPSPSHTSSPSSSSPSPASPSPASSSMGGHSSASASPASSSSVSPSSSIGSSRAESPSSGSMSTRPTAHPPASEAGRVMPDRKLPGDERRIVPSPRIGAESAQEHEPKAAEPDLRRRICENGPCKEVKPEPKPVEPDLRRRICKDGPCAECPPGQSSGKDGKCIGTTPTKNAVFNQCQPNEVWNGGACLPASSSCAPNESWNGARCTARTVECASIDSRAAMLANEIRGSRAEMQTACTNNPAGKQCSDLKQSYDSAVLRYRMLMNEAPVACRPGLQDPLSF